jgi:two-component system chemotaxis sensor kinase CheA
VRLTGELIVAKNAIGHLVKLAQKDSEGAAAALKDRHGTLERLVGELQRAVLAMRVLPLRSVLHRFPRLVREMSASLGKPATLLIEGEETEADKAIVEMLFEPLLHIVRNAMDHGVESPSVRAEHNKPAIATIRIRAARQKDQVQIEISDDGAGVDLARVRSVALERGVATAETLEHLSDKDAIDLIFAPGFSTSAMITEISGRGVGMDAVRTAVERVGGRINVESQLGLGTIVRFMLPYSVMLTQVMTVEAGGQVFGIPFDAVVETVRVPRSTIARVGAGHAIVLRNQTIPVIALAPALGVEQQTPEGEDALIVVATIAGSLGGVHVDRLGDRMEVILKPLEGLLAGTSGIAGTTLLGDGRVLLVLDLGGMLQ